jgi:hypothetical protein
MQKAIVYKEAWLYMKGDICVVCGNKFLAKALEDYVLDYISTCYSLIHWSISSLN